MRLEGVSSKGLQWLRPFFFFFFWVNSSCIRYKFIPELLSWTRYVRRDKIDLLEKITWKLFSERLRRVQVCIFNELINLGWCENYLQVISNTCLALTCRVPRVNFTNKSNCLFSHKKSIEASWSSYVVTFDDFCP